MYATQFAIYINGHIPVLAVHLLANMDAQAVVTLKGAADYVAKYISKYGAGQSVNAQIGSILDDVITKLPEGKKTTVSSILAKAFVATSVPDSLCALEAWHVIWDLGRVVCSRSSIGLCECIHGRKGTKLGARGMGGWSGRRGSGAFKISVQGFQIGGSPSRK